MPNSAVALAVQAIAREKNRIVIFSSPASSDLTGKACSPVGAHWTYDTYALAQVVGRAVGSEGLQGLVLPDRRLCLRPCPGGRHHCRREGYRRQGGGQYQGAGQYAGLLLLLLQAQASKAQVIALATAGADTQNAIKQAAEFGVTQSARSW